MLTLATILDNPGEPQAETRYRDPAELAALGYNGVVLYETTALSGIERVERIEDDEMRQWAGQLLDQVRSSAGRARAAGLKVFITYDVLSLARAVVAAEPDQYTCECEPSVLCPAAGAALAASQAALTTLIGRLAPLDGVVLRFGDNDAAHLPFLIGNDIYQPHCPRCSPIKPAERVRSVIDAFYRSVVEQHGLTLIVRAWNVRPNGMHDDADLCRRLHEVLPHDPRLMLSFKFTQTDFWRYQRWNASSRVWGDRPIMYELECQREYEGKGALPNWQAGLWRNGCSEVSDGDVDDASSGLAKVGRQVNLAGVWAWVRGGGWGGPFVSDETWIDANVFAAARLAARPNADPGELARQWASERLGIRDDDVAQTLADILARSAQTILESFYIGPYAQRQDGPWHPAGDWIADDILNADAAWQIVRQLPADSLDAAVDEKRRAMQRIGEDLAALTKLLRPANRARLEPLAHTLEYGEALLRTLYELIAALVDYRRFTAAGDVAASRRARSHLLAAQAAWTHHTQRTASLPGAATAFREVGFWSLTDRLIEQLTEQEVKVEPAGG